LQGGTNIDELLSGSEELLDSRDDELLTTDELDKTNSSPEEQLSASDELET